ncbi:hypothetical protein SCACP_40420 [Sporomusa carbonis]|uniref:hypothetical protein n=1 Tax=Sporomusa carbonis TaxID=3076075 RepID=UPI003A75BC4D
MAKNLRTIIFIFLVTILSLITVPCLASASTFTLGIYQGVQLSENQVVESKDAKADLTVSPRYKGYVAYAVLQATKLKEFETRPDLSNLTTKDVENFKELVFAPAAGYYYLVKSKDNRYYLCKLESFENQGKAQSYWKLTFSSEELSLK